MFDALSMTVGQAHKCPLVDMICNGCKLLIVSIILLLRFSLFNAPPLPPSPDQKEKIPDPLFLPPPNGCVTTADTNNPTVRPIATETSC